MSSYSSCHLGPPDVSATALADAITRACVVRGDPADNVLALIAECLALDASGQAEMLAHFRAEAARFQINPKDLST